MSTPFLHYQMNDSLDPGKDSSSNGINLVGGGTGFKTTQDSKRGTVVNFDGTNYSFVAAASFPVEFSGNNPFTAMMWIKHNDFDAGSGMVYWGGGSANSRLIMQLATGRYRIETGGPNQIVSPALPANEWVHCAVTFNGTNIVGYLDGVQVISYTHSQLDIDTNRIFYVGSSGSNSSTYMTGCMYDLRMYTSVISTSEIQAAAVFVFVPKLTLTPWSTFIEMSWSEEETASSYRITYNLTGENEIVSASGVQDLEYSLLNLEPGTEYTINVYSSTDDVNYTLHFSETTSTLSNTDSNANIDAFLNEEGGYDFSKLTDTTVSYITPHLNSLVTTGVRINFTSKSIPNTNLQLVNNGTSAIIPDNDSLFIPFEQLSGSSQEITLQLKDETTVTVSYDEVANNININGTTYSNGDVLILDGRKVTVYDV